MSKGFLSYFVIALTGYCLDLFIYLMLLSTFSDVYYSYVVALVMGLSFNVVLLRRFFKKGRFSLLKDIWLTLLANGFFLSLGFGLYAAMIALLGIAPLMSKLISSAITFGLNYMIRKTHF